jgi:hypothetical protein
MILELWLGGRDHMAEMIEVKGIEAFQISPRISVCSRTAMEVFFAAVTRCIYRFVIVSGSSRSFGLHYRSILLKGKIIQDAAPDIFSCRIQTIQ